MNNVSSSKAKRAVACLSVLLRIPKSRRNPNLRNFFGWRLATKKVGTDFSWELLRFGFFFFFCKINHETPGCHCRQSWKNWLNNLETVGLCMALTSTVVCSDSGVCAHIISISLTLIKLPSHLLLQPQLNTSPNMFLPSKDVHWLQDHPTCNANVLTC